jgi:hypothetical protein
MFSEKEKIILEFLLVNEGAKLINLASSLNLAVSDVQIFLINLVLMDG